MKIIEWLGRHIYIFMALAYLAIGITLASMFWGREIPGIESWDVLVYFGLLAVLIWLHGASDRRLAVIKAKLQEMTEGRTDDAVRFSEHLARGGKAKVKRSTVYHEDGSREENVSIELDTYEPGQPEVRRNSFGD